MSPSLVLHSISSMAGYAATAIASIIVFLCGSWIVKRARARPDAGGFWRRQSRAALEKAKFFQMREIPPPLKVIEDKLALEQTLTAISTARELVCSISSRNIPAHLSIRSPASSVSPNARPGRQWASCRLPKLSGDKVTATS